MPTEPYTPNPVPEGGSLEDTQRYLREEFERLSLSVRSTSVQAAYIGLQVNSEVLGTVDQTPSKISAWQVVQPGRPSRFQTNPPDNDEIIAEEDGVYAATFTMSVEITPGRRIEVRLYVNDNPTNTAAFLDASNQTNAVSLMFSNFGELTAGDRLSVWALCPDNNSTFNIEFSAFYCYRISELLRPVP